MAFGPGAPLPQGIPAVNGYNYNEMDDFRYDPYDPYTSTLPLASVTGGMIPSSMNYGKLPPGTLLRGQYQPPVSPLQQWLETGKSQHGGVAGFQVGQPVRICHLIAPECRPYNGLVGDILAVHDIEKQDFTRDMLFDVRCLVEGAPLRSWSAIGDDDYSQIAPSDFARQAAVSNRTTIAPMYGLMANAEAPDESMLPPFVILSRLPSEKLEPLASMSKGTTGTRRMNCLPPQVRPPIWGEPMAPVVVGTLPPIPQSQAQQLMPESARSGEPAPAPPGPGTGPGHGP